MHGQHRRRDSPALDRSHTARNRERSAKRRYLSEDLGLASTDDGRIAKELAALAAIQLLKSFVVTRRDLHCLDRTPGIGRAGPDKRRQVTAEGTFARTTFSGTLGLRGNPWICGLEQDSSTQDTNPTNRGFVWDIGYDGPQSICSGESTANNSGDDSTHSARHKHWWRKAATGSARKLASKSEPFLSRHRSCTERDAAKSGEYPGDHPLAPLLLRLGNTFPPQNVSPDDVPCPQPKYHSLEHETSYAQLSILRVQDSTQSHPATHISCGPFGSFISHRFRRSKSLFEDDDPSEWPLQNPRERRRECRQLSIFSEPSVFEPTPMFSGYRPNLIAVASVMMATGVLNRLSSRTNNKARERTDDRMYMSLSESMVTPPSGQANTLAARSGFPPTQGLKLIKEEFPTVAPANSPISGSGTPAAPDSLQRSFTTGSQVEPRHLWKDRSREDHNRNMDHQTSLSLSGSELHVPMSTSQREQDKASGRIWAASTIPRDTEKPSCNGSVPRSSSKVKLEDHCPFEIIQEGSHPARVSPPDPSHEATKSPRLGPYTPCFESAEEFRMWQHASKLRQRSSSPSPPRPVRLGVVGKFGDMHEMLNEKPPPAL